MKFLLPATLGLLFFLSAQAQSTKSAPVTWPTEVKLSGDQNLLLYQPQVESLTENKVEGRVAFKLTQGKKDFFGSFRLEAQALISKTDGVVELSQFKVKDLQVPTAKIDDRTLRAELEKKLHERTFQVSYKSLVDNLAASEGTLHRKDLNLKNEAPDFVFSSAPSILIMISGNPKWVDSPGAKEVQRIVNSSALFLHEKDSNDYYLWALGQWYQAPQSLGPYVISKSAPSSKFVMIKDQLIKDKKVDPLEGKMPDGQSIYPPGLSPNIIVATKPTELLQSSGDPKYSAVEGTSLLFMSNSPNSIFLDSKSQNYFVLVSGRWFRGPSLKGPWNFVSGKDLPKDFARIPVNSPVAEVLVSVPGTAQAKEALVVSQIPQTAQVKRDLKPKEIECDGEKQWEAISSTSLKYAKNCNTPMIQINPSSYYAVQNGVWFTASSANGPWTVAIAVPSEIYKIPTSSPLYYVTYVRVYGSTADMVTVGYTPGYHGTFVSADGTIVYGTGYDYNSYTSSNDWYPAPSTYGFGVGYGWEYDAGFYMGFSMGSVMYPWGWGTCCYGAVYIDIDITNTYTQWGRHTVISGPGGQGLTVDKVGKTKFYRGSQSDNIYATRDGQVYRRTDSGWEKNIGPGSWTDVERNNAGQLEKMHTARNPERDLARAPTSRPEAAPMPHLRGGSARAGGARGGGGFRR